MAQLQIRFRVYASRKDGGKPSFERIVTLGESEQIDIDSIVKALRQLFGRSSTVNVEYYEV